jgi:hypothetical protein
LHRGGENIAERDITQKEVHAVKGARKYINKMENKGL